MVQLINDEDDDAENRIMISKRKETTMSDKSTYTKSNDGQKVKDLKGALEASRGQSSTTRKSNSHESSDPTYTKTNNGRDAKDYSHIFEEGADAPESESKRSVEEHQRIQKRKQNSDYRRLTML